MHNAQMPQTHYRYRVLMGAMQQNAVMQYVRLSCVPEEANRSDEILQLWRVASARMRDLAQSEPGWSDQITAVEPPASVHGRLQEIAGDRLFRASFSDLPTDFAVVEIDRLVAPQRDVNLDYVDDLRARIPGRNIEELVDICVGPREAPPDLKVLQNAANQMTFTSRSLDLRFLGGYRKTLTEEDIAVAHGGGQPVEAITLLVGYGAASINVHKVGNRFVLWNGFHRITALRMEGITHAPVVVQHVAQPEIEFPDQYLGLSRVYLLQERRPVVIKDFFDPALTVDLRVAPRRKVTKVAWGNEDGVIPE